MNIFHRIKIIDLDNFIFYIFCMLLFFVPFNTRKIIPSQYTFLSGSFNEFVTYSLYFTDILAITIISLCVIYERKRVSSQLIYVRYSKIGKVFVFFLSWILLTTALNTTYGDFSMYQTIRMAIYLGMTAMMIIVVRSRKRLIMSLIIISIAGFMQGGIALLQFFRQSSLFGDSLFHKLTGESLISRDVIGTSNMLVDGEKIIRSYGTFPHPNILGAYLLISILITIYLFIIRTDILNKVNIHINTRRLTCQQYAIDILILISLCVQTIGLVVTFSRSVFITLFAVTFVNLFIFRIVSRETIYNTIAYYSKPNAIKKSLSYLIFSAIILSSLMFGAYVFIQRMQSESIQHQSFQDRILLRNVSRETIFRYPLFGTGIGTYILNIKDNFSGQIVNYWQYQPDHNLYMLIMSEIGIPGLIIFIYLIYLIYKANEKNIIIGKISIESAQLELILYRSILISIMILGLFDHYFWTSNQMRLFLWIILGLIIGTYYNYSSVSRQFANNVE